MNFHEMPTLANITTNNVIFFLWKNIIYRFGITKILITNNRTPFDSYKMKEQCQRLHNEHQLSSISHPQTNGQVELTNKVLLNGLKKKIT
jgi:transposase InsO family protein